MAKKAAIPRIEEKLEVSKRARLTGRVRLRKTVRRRSQTLDIPLRRDEAVVRRVPVNRVVSAPVAVRQEGAVTIVPVLEEVPVVTMQLVLREELHIEVRSARVAAQREVELRSEHIEVTRSDPPDRPPPSE